MKKFISIFAFISLLSVNSFATTAADEINEQASGSAQSTLPKKYNSHKEVVSTNLAEVITKIDAKVGDVSSLKSKAKPVVPARRAR